MITQLENGNKQHTNTLSHWVSPLCCIFYKTWQTCTVAFEVFNTLADRLASQSLFKLKDDLSTSVCHVFISVHLWTESAMWPLLFLEKPVLPSLSLFAQDQFVIYHPVCKDHKYLAFTATKHWWVIPSTFFPFWFQQRASALEGNKLFCAVGGPVWVNTDTGLSDSVHRQPHRQYHWTSFPLVTSHPGIWASNLLVWHLLWLMFISKIVHVTTRWL